MSTKKKAVAKAETYTQEKVQETVKKVGQWTPQSVAQKVTDATSGFRAYRREVLERIPWAALHSPGYSFLVEVLYWGSQDPRLRILEVPICFTERRAGKSKMSGSIVTEALVLPWKLRRLR